MNRIKSLISVVVLSILTSVAFRRAAGAGADYNKAERERLQRKAEVQRKRAECTKSCNRIFRSQYAACGGYALAAQPTCTLNTDKNTAQCYQGCK